MERRTNSQTRAVSVANIQTTNINLISLTAPRISNTLANPYLEQSLSLVLAKYLFSHQGRNANNEMN